jgi:formamidopyrimidine-DNA glycosylase
LPKTKIKSIIKKAFLNMPELPEVETIRQDLRKKIINKKIVDVILSGKERIQGVSTDEFVDFLKNNNFIEIDRIGKLLIFVFENNKKN